MDGLDTGPNLQSIVGRRLFLIVREFLFFKPDEYPLAVAVHDWQQPPPLRDNVFDLAGSATVTRVRVLRIDGSPLVRSALGAWHRDANERA